MVDISVRTATMSKRLSVADVLTDSGEPSADQLKIPNTVKIVTMSGSFVVACVMIT